MASALAKLLAAISGIRKTPVPDQLLINSGIALIETLQLNQETPRALSHYEVKVFSQWGEDGILSYLVKKLGIDKPRMLELGVGNFEECNSRFLAEYLGASVYGIDYRKDLVESVRQQDISWRTNIFAVSDWITPENIQQHFSKAQTALGGIDILSIDLDGNDYWIMKKLTLDNIPIIVCEYNPIFGEIRPLTIPQSSGFDRTQAHFSWLYFGASLQAWIRLLEKSGHEFIGSNRAGNNAFFVKKEFVEKLNLLKIDSSNLKSFVDWRVRESRNEEGRLSFLTLQEARNLIANMPVIDLETNLEVTLGEWGT
jgi:hypothetical protein